MSLLTPDHRHQGGMPQSLCLIGRAQFAGYRGMSGEKWVVGLEVKGGIVMAPSPQGIGNLLHQLMSSEPSLSLHQRQFSFLYPSKDLFLSLISFLWFFFFQSSFRLLVAEAFTGRGRMEALSFWPHTQSSSPPSSPFPLSSFSCSHIIADLSRVLTLSWWTLFLPPPPNQTPLFSLHCFLSPPFLL